MSNRDPAALTDRIGFIRVCSNAGAILYYNMYVLAYMPYDKYELRRELGLIESFSLHSEVILRSMTGQLNSRPLFLEERPRCEARCHHQTQQTSHTGSSRIDDGASQGRNSLARKDR